MSVIFRSTLMSMMLKKKKKKKSSMRAAATTEYIFNDMQSVKCSGAVINVFSKDCFKRFW